MKSIRLLTIALTITILGGLSTPAFSQDPAPPPATVEPAPAAEPAPAPEPTPVVSLEKKAPAEVSTPEVAPAAADSASPALSRIMTHVIELMATLLGLLMAALLAKATAYFTKKTKIEIPAKTEEMIAGWGTKAVHYASEKAHQYNKEKGDSMKGPEKLEVALGFGIGLAEEYGMTNLAKEKLTKYIEIHLGEKRSSPMLTAIVPDEA